MGLLYSSVLRAVQSSLFGSFAWFFIFLYLIVFTWLYILVLCRLILVEQSILIVLVQQDLGGFNYEHRLEEKMHRGHGIHVWI